MMTMMMILAACAISGSLIGSLLIRALRKATR